MTRTERIIKNIKEYIAHARKRFPEITDDMLYTEDTTEFIFYMNGNDGTHFDYFVNSRLCEFCVFYKETGMGFIKVFVNANDPVTGYIYPDNGEGDAITLDKVMLKHYDALYLATFLNKQADCKKIYDKPIDKINLKHRITTDDCYRFVKKYGSE